MPGLGHLAYIGIKKEAIWGTKVVASMDFMEFMSETVAETIEEKIVQGINAGRVRTKRVQGAKLVAGDITWEVNVEDGIGDILKNLLPTEVFVDDGAGNGGQHTFTPGNTPGIGLTLQVGRDTAVRDYYGGKVSSLAFTAAAGELLQATAALTFKDGEAGTPQTPSYDTQNPLVYHTGTIQIDNVAAEISTFAITIAGGMKVDRRKLGSNLILQQQPGMYEVTGTFEMAFDNETEINKFLAGTASKLSIDLTGPVVGTTTRRLRIIVPQAFYNGETPKITGADAETRITLPFVGIKTGSGSPNKLVEIKLDNSYRTAAY
jgi:hypothetical protein